MEHWKLTTLLWQPAIPFNNSESKNKSKDHKDEEEDIRPTVTITMELVKGSGKGERNLVAHKVPKFDSTSPEEYCDWRTAMDELYVQKGCQKDPGEQLALLRSILTGNTLKTFQAAYNRES
jgi:hypothetical protein